MKKLFFTLAIALGTLAVANAQEVGKMWVGGTVGVWSSKTKVGDVKGDNQLSFKVMPEFGYILSENIGVGIAVGAAHTHATTDGETLETDFVNSAGSVSTAANIYTVNPFLRYTFLKGELGSLFFDGGVAYSWGKVVSGGIKSHELEAGIRPGVAVNVSEKVSLIGKFGFLGYQNTKLGSGDTAVKTNSFGFDFDLNNIQLGMNLKF